MNELTIALLQMTSCGTDQDANREKGAAFCRRARAMGADIALFPEMWNVGYPPFEGLPPNSGNIWRAPSVWQTTQVPAPHVTPDIRRRWQAQAIERQSAFVQHYQALARELEMAIALTYLERWDGAPRNSMSLIDRHGEIVMTYAKVHTCAFDEPEASTTPGDDFYVVELDTAHGPVKIGAMICFDREFPESARVLMLKGAEIILTPNACELDTNRLHQFRTRAFENMVGVAMANYAAPQQNGHSVAFHPIAYGQQGTTRDLLVIEAGEGEGVHLAAFDLDDLREYRQREVHANAFRRPDRYGELTSPEVSEPFVRVDATGRRYPRSSHQT
ncbi:MAG TPA: carbon-nitrogen hydrolase family protein [Nitrolancea sp.]|nr:carbon-nitrogen hydrolase family protein [Nitrolancea sp.]